MPKDSSVKQYFRERGRVSSWWNKESVEQGESKRLYEKDWETIQSLIAEERREIALEVSCGYGRLTKNLSGIFKELFAVDISKEMLEKAQSLKLKNTKFSQADAENLPFKDNKFDCVICVKSFVHYSNTERSLAEFYRVLKPRGALIVDIDNKFSLRRILKNLANAISQRIFKDFTIIGKGIFFPYSKSQFLGLINTAGFSLEKILFIHLFPPINISIGNRKIPIISPRMSQGLEKPANFLEKFPIVREFATYIFAKCRKP